MKRVRMTYKQMMSQKRLTEYIQAPTWEEQLKKRPPLGTPEYTEWLNGLTPEQFEREFEERRKKTQEEVK
jgi:hypothetical protein